MTKQTKTLAVLAAALVVCGGAYAALRVWNGQQAQIDDTVYVTQLSDLTALSFTNAQGELSFTKAEDVWQYDGDDAFPADQEAVEDLAEQVGSLAAIRVIDDPEDLSAYGLDEPALQASVTAGGDRRHPSAGGRVRQLLLRQADGLGYGLHRLHRPAGEPGVPGAAGPGRHSRLP